MCLQSFLRNSIANWAAFALLLACTRPAFSGNDNREGRDDDGPPKTLYVWSGSQVPNVSAFLAVVDFDEDSPSYGEVIKTVSVPPPYDLGNEPHHCHLSTDKNILGCGGLLSVLKGQDGIFFFDVSSPRDPKYLFSTSARHSSITDDFLPLEPVAFWFRRWDRKPGASPGGSRNSTHS